MILVRRARRWNIQGMRDFIATEKESAIYRNCNRLVGRKNGRNKRIDYYGCYSE